MGSHEPAPVNWPGMRGLAGLCAVLAVVLALEWLVPNAALPGPARAGPARHAAIALGLPARDTDGWEQAVLARPVFSISRRPPRVAARGPSQAALGEARLSGIMITRAGRRAIFAPEGGGHALVLAEGASVNQSTLQNIYPDRVVLASGAVLRPSYDRNRPAQTTSVFQPIQPGFQPTFPNAPFPQPGFPQPGFPPPGFPQQGALGPQGGGTEEGVPQPQILQNQNFRGIMNPQRRE